MTFDRRAKGRHRGGCHVVAAVTACGLPMETAPSSSRDTVDHKALEGSLTLARERDFVRVEPRDAHIDANPIERLRIQANDPILSA